MKVVVDKDMVEYVNGLKMGKQVERIFAGESKNLEFKVSRPEKSIKYMKSVVAYANGKGGY